MKEVNLDQRSDDWLLWRQKGVGSSDAPVIMEEVNWTSPDELVDIKAGRQIVVETERMARGTRLEPVAREKYTEVTGIHTRPVCVVHDTVPWLRASLDGLSEDNQIVLEIKCPSDHAHRQALQGQYPRYYRAQLQHHLLVTGLPVLHYWSFTDNPAFPATDRYKLIEVPADLEYQERLFRREWAFIRRLREELNLN